MSDLPAPVDQRAIIRRDPFLAYASVGDGLIGFLTGVFGGAGAFIYAIALIASLFSGAGIAAGLGGLGMLTLTATCGYILVLACGSPNGPDRHGSAGRVFDARVQRRRGRLDAQRERTVARIDAAHGWRPREGERMPAGRTDTHDRYRVLATATSTGLDLRVVRWIYQDVWSPQSLPSTARTHRHLTEDELATDEGLAFTTQHEMEAEASRLEGRSAISAAEAVAIAEEAAARLTERERVAQLINAEPSV